MCLWGAAPPATLSPRATLAAYHLRERRDNNSLWLSFTHRAHMLELPWRGWGKTLPQLSKLFEMNVGGKLKRVWFSVGSTSTSICDVPHWMK